MMLRLMMGGVLALTLAGCETHRDRGVKIGEMVVTNAKGNHPIVVSKKMVQFQIPVRRGDYALSVEQRSELGQFIDRYRREGEGKLVISAPAGQPNEAAAYHVLDDVRDTMKSHGIVRQMVKLEPYSPPSDPEAPILVGFLGYEAKGPECGPLTRDMTGDRRNLPYEQLSCAIQANTAAMVANPRDLVMAREETARPGERRDVLWGKFVKGESTETEKTKEQQSNLNSEAGTN
jgi:pilus assembly protein CpaD